MSSRLVGWQTVRFGLVGILNTGVDLGAFALLSTLGASLLLANFVSTTLGLLCSFFLNRGFTFRAGGAGFAWRQAVTFVAVTGVGLWAIQPLVIVLLAPLVMSGLGVGSEPSVLVAKIAAIAVGLVWNYLLYHFVVFRVPRQSRTSAEVRFSGSDR